MIKKDIIMLIITLNWIISNLVCSYLDRDFGVVISNCVFISIMIILIIIKNKSNKFNNYLNQKLRQNV